MSAELLGTASASGSTTTTAMTTTINAAVALAPRCNFLRHQTYIGHVV